MQTEGQTKRNNGEKRKEKRSRMRFDRPILFNMLNIHIWMAGKLNWSECRSTIELFSDTQAEQKTHSRGRDNTGEEVWAFSTVNVTMDHKKEKCSEMSSDQRWWGRCGDRGVSRRRIWDALVQLVEMGTVQLRSLKTGRQECCGTYWDERWPFRVYTETKLHRALWELLAISHDPDSFYI